jgi:hypothetical protein
MKQISELKQLNIPKTFKLLDNYNARSIVSEYRLTKDTNYNYNNEIQIDNMNLLDKIKKHIPNDEYENMIFEILDEIYNHVDDKNKINSISIIYNDVGLLQILKIYDKSHRNLIINVKTSNNENNILCF